MAGAVINSAINDILNQSDSGGKVMISEGRFELDEPIIIPNTGDFDDSNFPVHLEGSGWSTEILSGSSLDRVIELQFSESSDREGDRIAHMRLRAVDDSAATRGIEFTDPSGNENRSQGTLFTERDKIDRISIQNASIIVSCFH